MKIKCCALAIIYFGGIFAIAENHGDNNKKLSNIIRVLPHDEYYFLCRGTNKSDGPLLLMQVVTPFADGNTIIYGSLSNVRSGMRATGVANSHIDFPPLLQIKSSGMYVLNIGGQYSNRIDFLKGNYVFMKWSFGGVESDGLYVGFPRDDGALSPPVVDVPLRYKTWKDQISIAFIFHKNKPRELGFLVLNKRDDAFVAVEPLTNKSSILAVSKEIDYRREIFFKDKEIIEKSVPSGEVAEWRVAWVKVLELIPEADQKKIIEGGGDLDLIWRTGGEESRPLRMNIAPIESFKDSIIVPHPEIENVSIISNPHINK